MNKNSDNLALLIVVIRTEKSNTNLYRKGESANRFFLFFNYFVSL